MVDLDILKMFGCDEDSLRNVFQMEKDGSFALTKSDTERGRKVERLKTLIRSRINEGRDNNVANYRVYQALDKAWDAPLNQITPTMIQSLVDSEMDVDKLGDTLKTWGVNVKDIFTEYPDPKNPSKTIKEVNVPAFYRIFVPLVRSYVTIRRAKAMNDRRLLPFMKYEPAISNEMTRVRCEVITSRVEDVSSSYGFWETEDQACWRMLHYGTCFRFLVEEWHREEQLVEGDSPYEAEEGEELILGPEQKIEPTIPTPPPPAIGPASDGGEALAADLGQQPTEPGMEGAMDGGEASIPILPEPEPMKSFQPAYKKVVMREGLRYHMPHPTRTFYDMAWPLNSFNTNTGGTYAGYWRVMRYGEILNKKKFFNLGVVAVGTSGSWFNNNKTFFESVYPCSLKFPGSEEAGAGAGEHDAERHVSDGVYATADEDKGIILTELFMKLIPSEYGIGKYDFPVWFRFVVANNDTIIYATPLPYSSPVLFDGYDHVSGRTMNPSMSLEILPFQDHFGNLLSQYLLSVKQNLTNLVMIDKDAVSEEEIGWLRKATQKLWSGINIVGFSRRLFNKGQQNPEVTFPQRFPQVDTAAIASAMKTVLEILERVLVMSAQELGQAASHEQTREEVRNIQSNTSTRAEFTMSSLDRSKQAWKRQVYEGLMAYGSDTGYAQIASDPKVGAEELSALGFTWEDEDQEKKRVTVKYNKTAIRYETFAANRDGNDRINDRELAAQMGAFMQQLAANPMLLQALGPDQFVTMANWVAKASGFPRDLKLVNRGPDQTPEEQQAQQMQQIQEFLGQAMEQLKGQIEEEMKGVVTAIVKENDEQSDQIAQNTQQIAVLTKEMVQHMKALGGAQEAMMPPDLREPMPTMDMPGARANGAPMPGM